MREREKQLIEAYEQELSNLRQQRKAAQLQYEVAREHLAGISRQIEAITEHMEAMRQGQLPLDIRPEPALA